VLKPWLDGSFLNWVTSFYLKDWTNGELPRPIEQAIRYVD